jgi:hypothetical protein
MITLDNEDKRFFIATLIAPLIVWWILTGRKKYAVKGMK